jgi:DNA adenine methylase
VTNVTLHGGTCTCLDFEEMFGPGEAVFFLDPPFYEKGPGLYQFSFTAADHERLARLLEAETRPWLMTYDAHPAIRRLYTWAHVVEIRVNYMVGGRSKKTELLLSNRQLHGSECVGDGDLVRVGPG